MIVNDCNHYERIIAVILITTMIYISFIDFIGDQYKDDDDDDDDINIMTIGHKPTNAAKRRRRSGWAYELLKI